MYRFYILIPKGHMVFFEFWSRSYFLDLLSFIAIFRTGAPYGDLPGYVVFFSKLICRFGDIRV